MISLIRNSASAALLSMKNIGGALWAIGCLLSKGAGALSGEGTVKQRLLALALEPATQRLIFKILRPFKPNISLKRQLVKAYPNSGTVIVTRRQDVLDVLYRNEDFEVVYEPRMRELTAGENFFLGMQPGWPYQRDTSSMRLAARRSDVAELIRPQAVELAEKIVAESGGKLDLPQMLTLQVPWNMCATYFGTPGPDAASMQDWTTTLFWYLFGDLGADPAIKAKAMQAARDLRDYLDAAIADRKANPTEKEDILNRCLDLQKAATPGMDDIGIRNNLLGLLIGANPTISKASNLILDELLNRPDELAQACAAARADDDQLFNGYLWEALRFNPHNPVIYRRATRDCQIAPGSLRRCKVNQGQMVFATNFSAMFDPKEVPSPDHFDPRRTWETYIHWGYGMHMCFGDRINQLVIPAILKPVLKQQGLRRAPGAAGQIDTKGTPFPAHFHIEFD